MPMTHEIDPERKLIRITGSGVLQDRDIIDCVAAIQADPRLEPGMDILSDVRGIEVGFSTDGIRSMVELMVKGSEPGTSARVAVVVSHDAAFGMGRAIEARSEEPVGLRFEIFRDIGAAMAWLGHD